MSKAGDIFIVDNSDSNGVTLSESRKKVEKQLINDFLHPLQVPAGVSPVLEFWMKMK